MNKRIMLLSFCLLFASCNKQDEISQKTGGGGAPSSMVTKKGVLGVSSGANTRRQVANADVFGKGGYTQGIDAILAGAGGLKAGSSTEEFQEEAKTLKVEPATQTQAKSIQTPMLIKTGYLAFQVKSCNKVKQDITTLVPKFHGYISSENEETYSGTHTCEIAIRVPSAQFDRLVNEISKSGSNFDRREISVQDVGEEFADITARMRAKFAVEQRFVAILARANKVSEILEIEQKIGEVREEIESMQGRLNYLKNQVSYSTLTVTFYEQTPVTATQRVDFFSQVLSSLKNGWVGLLEFVVELISIWPFLLFVSGMYILIRRIWSKWRNRKSASAKLDKVVSKD